MPSPSSPAKPARRKQGRRERPASVNNPDLREEILGATVSLLANQQFGDLTVSDILSAAGVSRGTFYFYFDSKHDVLAELVKRAVAQGHDAATPWLANPADKVAALRTGTAAGAQRWMDNGPILRAIVENWRTDPRLTALWLEQMQTFTHAAVAQIEVDPVAVKRLVDVDVIALASSLTWLNERVFYLAAIDIPPFHNQDAVVDTLVHIWASALYGT